MADPLGSLLDLVGPFLFPVVLFLLGLVGYGVLVALGQAGVLDAGAETRAGRAIEEEAVGEERDGGDDRREEPRRR